MKNNFWIDCKFSIEATIPTNYRSVLNEYYDYEEKKTKEAYFLEYQYTTYFFLKLLGLVLFDKISYKWERVRKPEWSLVIGKKKDLRGETAKKTQSFWFDVSIKEDWYLTTNETLLYVNSQTDNLDEFMNKWISYDDYYENYYCQEIKKYVLGK